MKNIFFTLFVVSQLFTFKVNANEKKNEFADIKVIFTVGGEIGIKEKDCKNFGLSCLELDVSVEVSRLVAPSPGSSSIQFETLPNNQLRLTFFSKNTGDFEVKQNTSLKNTISKALGYSDVIILSGVYKTQKRSDGAYVVTVKTQTK